MPNITAEKQTPHWLPPPPQLHRPQSRCDLADESVPLALRGATIRGGATLALGKPSVEIVRCDYSR